MLARNWCGLLTFDNLPLVVDLLHSIFDGKKYTFVSVNELFGMRPVVRTSQELDKITTYKNSGPAGGGWESHGLYASDTYGVWALNTSMKSESDPHIPKTPYLVFDYDRVTIEHFAPGGNSLCWVLALEC